jgi:hypothetical protein
MKKNTVWLVVLLVGFVMAAALFAGAADDYQVIKNAVKKSETATVGAKNVQWFKIRVTGKNGDQEKVNLTFPVSLVEMLLNSCPQEKFPAGHGCEIDIRRVWNDLKKAGPLALVEIEDHGETVKIWLE